MNGFIDDWEEAAFCLLDNSDSLAGEDHSTAFDGYGTFYIYLDRSPNQVKVEEYRSWDEIWIIEGRRAQGITDPTRKLGGAELPILANHKTSNPTNEWHMTYGDEIKVCVDFADRDAKQLDRVIPEEPAYDSKIIDEVNWERMRGRPYY